MTVLKQFKGWLESFPKSVHQLPRQHGHAGVALSCQSPSNACGSRQQWSILLFFMLPLLSHSRGGSKPDDRAFGKSRIRLNEGQCSAGVATSTWTGQISLRTGINSTQGRVEIARGRTWPLKGVSPRTRGSRAQGFCFASTLYLSFDTPLFLTKSETQKTAFSSLLTMHKGFFVVLASALLSAVTAHPLDPARSDVIKPNDAHPPAAPQPQPHPHPHANNFHQSPPENPEVEPYPRPHPMDVAREARALKMAKGTNAARLSKGLPPLPPARRRDNGRVSVFPGVEGT